MLQGCYRDAMGVPLFERFFIYLISKFSVLRSQCKINTEIHTLCIRNHYKKQQFFVWFMSVFLHFFAFFCVFLLF